MNYYNDNDPKACAWLRELIAAGEIAPGVVDERSILEIKADELAEYDQCHFFAGIGGWALALRWAGLEGVAGIWTGSCPCQPLSCAGKRQGDADERHLWPAFHGLIAERRPPVVFGEQVASKDGREWFAGVRLDLEGLGYACGGADLCAAGVGAPHRRQRLFWVADAADVRRAQHERESREHENEESHDAAERTWISWVANSNGRNEGDGGVQRSREHGQREENGGVMRLADVQRKGLEGQRGHGDGRREPGRDGAEAARHAAACGATGKLADSAGARHAGAGTGAGDDGDGKDQDAHGERCVGQPADGGGLGHAAGRGCGVGGDAPLAGRGGHTERPGWARCDILPCRDGKARRVEAGTFPLADGIPGRMGLLRGYGNAIVPQLAAEFVMAWREATGLRVSAPLRETGDLNHA